MDSSSARSKFAVALSEEKCALPAAAASPGSVCQLLQLEFSLLQQLMYKNGNQHKNTKYFGRMQQTRSRIRSLDLPYLDNLLLAREALKTDELKLASCYVLICSHFILEEALNLITAAHPYLSQLIETKVTVAYSSLYPAAQACRDRVLAVQNTNSVAKYCQKMESLLSAFPAELLSEFSIARPTKPSRKHARNADPEKKESVPQKTSAPSAAKPNALAEDLGEIFDEGELLASLSAPMPATVAPAMPATSSPGLAKPSTTVNKQKAHAIPNQSNKPTKPQMPLSLSEMGRVSPAAKRKHPDFADTIQSDPKRPKLEQQTQPERTKPQNAQAKAVTPQKPTTSQQQKPSQAQTQQKQAESKPAKPQKFSFSDSLAKETKPASIFAPSAAASTPVVKKPSAASNSAKSMDKLFAALVGAKKKK